MQTVRPHTSSTRLSPCSVDKRITFWRIWAETRVVKAEVVTSSLPVVKEYLRCKVLLPINCRHSITNVRTKFCLNARAVCTDVADQALCSMTGCLSD